MAVDRPWDDLHHRSYFLPHLQKIESSLSNPSTSVVHTVLSPFALRQFSTKGDMFVISQTIPVKVSRNPNIIENVFIGANCSPEEIQTYTNLFKEFHYVFGWSYNEMAIIDPSIV